MPYCKICNDRMTLDETKYCKECGTFAHDGGCWAIHMERYHKQRTLGKGFEQAL